MAKIALIYFTCLIPFTAIAQRIDNNVSFRDIDTNSYFRFSYDNDYFGQSDYYYSQGFGFELFHPSFKGNLVNFIFPKLKTNKHGLSFEHFIFTPRTITSDSIIPGDRPYAAGILLKFSLISTDSIHKSRLSSALSIGAIGPGAFGQEMQDGFHQYIGSVKTKGWDYQIRNDLLLNYELAYEQQLLRLQDYFALHSEITARLGTVNTNVSGGFSGVLGLINSPYQKQNRKFIAYVYGQAQCTLIGYDATLQGGLINRDSPYTISSNDITRITVQQNFGIVVQWKRFYLEYTRSWLTKEFRSGESHHYGGVRVGYEL